jgi:hypothetical protein
MPPAENIKSTNSTAVLDVVFKKAPTGKEIKDTTNHSFMKMASEIYLTEFYQ